MTQCIVRRTLLLFATTAMAITAPTAIAQTGTAPNAAPDTTADAAYVPTLTFDVASVREIPPSNSRTFSGGFLPHSSQFRATLDTRSLLSIAYGVDDFQVSGRPDWATDTMFDVQAKSDHSVDETLAKLNKKDALLEQQHMLQGMLAERFKLKVHWETKQGPVYELVVAKGGSKLHPAGSMPPTAEELKAFGDNKIPEINQRTYSRGSEYFGHECSIEALDDYLRDDLGRNVVDKTGLIGKYDFHLQFNEGVSDEKRANNPNIWPALIDAIQDQLGLKLVPAKDPIQFLVIDHIEMPSAN